MPSKNGGKLSGLSRSSWQDIALVDTSLPSTTKSIQIGLSISSFYLLLDRAEFQMKLSKLEQKDQGSFSVSQKNYSIAIFAQAKS